MNVPKRFLLSLALLVLVPGAGNAQQHAGHPLGAVDFPITCSKQAQVEFNRAVALLHHMTYSQARESFQKVATIDPECAMAHWGIAMTLFQPLWPTRPGPAALQRGWDAVQKAKAVHPATERERLFVAAAEAFFLEPGSSDYWLRIRRWEQATEKVYAAFPDDAEAAAQLQRLRATARLEPTFKTAFHLASTQARYALERRAWNEASPRCKKRGAM